MSASQPPVRCMIVDDEQPARALLRSLLEASPHPVHIVAEAGNISDALPLLRSLTPDVLLLDINLSPGSGFDLLEQYRNPVTEVIFVTAYDQYALRAIKASALDYLVKPITQDDLDLALARCTALKPAGAPAPEDTGVRLDVLREQLHLPHTQIARIVLPTARGFRLMASDEILYCEADRTYTHFHLRDGSKHTCSRPLKHYDDILVGQGFFRCHQSWLINLMYVNEYERRKKGGNIIMQNGAEVPLSETARKDFQLLFLGGTLGDSTALQGR